MRAGGGSRGLLSSFTSRVRGLKKTVISLESTTVWLDKLLSSFHSAILVLTQLFIFVKWKYYDISKGECI